MGLFRLFWVPHGTSAADGTYVRYPAAELYAILALESQRHRALVVGENLGTVPAEVNRAMRRRGLRGMYVAQYELDPEPRPVPAGTLAALNTHDAPPFAAFWRGDDIDDRADLGLASAQEAAAEHGERARLRRAIAAALRERGRLGAGEAAADVLAAWLEELAASAATIVVVALEDLWLETRPQNVPGTSSERPNWQRRARYSLEDLFERPEPAALLDRVQRLRRAGGPSNAGR
jgi:4-alpha-glucanotransferase